MIVSSTVPSSEVDPTTGGCVAPASFRPHPLLRSAHLQTIVPTLMRPLPKLSLQKERWEFADGDFVNLGWFARPNPGQPIAVLVHGLTGGFESKYLRGTANRLVAAGWAGVILELRGAGAEPNRLPRNYHQGDTTDLIALLKRLRSEHADSRLATIGWSLGGNIVLKAAGECGDQHAADVVVAASVPFALEPCVERLNSGFSRTYQRRMLKDLVAMMQDKLTVVDAPAGADPQRAAGANCFREFDEAWTAPVNGFASAEEYYDQTQCGNFLRDIRRSTLIVHAADDPFMQPGIVPGPEEMAACVRLEIARHGGHVGFMAAGPWGMPRFWLERRIVAWLTEGAA